MGMPFSLYRKFRWNFYKVKRALCECAARREEISCFATLLTREEFASELFNLCRALSESKSKTQLELSANDTCALNKNKQSAVRI